MLSILSKSAVGVLLASLFLVSGLKETNAAESNGDFSTLEQQMEEYERDNIQSIHKRIYVKERRHEFTLFSGGVLRSDGYILGGASYTFHLFESLGLEGVFAYGGQAFDDNSLVFGHANIEFAPLYGKFSLFTLAILTFDFTFSGGVGFMRRNGLRSTQGALFDVGVGTRVFLNRWLAFRIDFRDYFYRDQLKTNDIRLEQNFTLMGGLSVFFPFKASS